MNKEAIIQKEKSFLAGTYTRFPLVISRGKRCTVWDSEGRSYTDFVAGIAVCNLGHANQRIADTMYSQAKRLIHASNLYYTEPQTLLGEWLIEKSFADRVFFCNSGAEANEAAIKLARKFFKDHGKPERFRIITMEGSFHGRTMATLSATGQDKVRKGFDPLLEGFDIVPFNNTEAIDNAINDKTCAIMLEPIQGEGGVRCPSRSYLKDIREICNEQGILLILDEVQTGMGRTGTLFAYEQFGVEPDIMTLAKALANGLPMGAMLATEKVAKAFGPGSHASTFGGNPLVASVALCVLKILFEDNVLRHCQETGKYFKDRLDGLKLKYPFIIKEIRGKGLLLGMEIDGDGSSIVNSCMERGFLINCTQRNVLRFIPPLIISRDEIDDLITCLDQIFKEMVEDR
nr:aspartate aminotransferase family protein [Desulfobacterales bacterium]